MRRCAVIGAGLAGLSAAHDLVRAGVHVTLIEARPHAGGRARSFADAASGAELDNGQHLLMGCYTSTLAFMQSIGSAGLLRRVHPMRIPFIHADGRRAVLAAGSLPHPLSLVQGFLGYSLLPLRARVGVLRVALAVRMLSRTRLEALDARSVRAWLEDLGQGREAVEHLWRPIVLATMNTDVDAASAKLFAVVLREVFLGSAESSALLLPRAGLSALFADPARAFLRARDADVRMHARAERLLVRDRRVCGVVLADGSVIESDAVVSALPVWEHAALMQRTRASENPDVRASQRTDIGHPSPLGRGAGGEGGVNERVPVREGGVADFVTRFIPAPIVSVHVWTDAPFTTEEMTGTLGTHVQWVFAKGRTPDGAYHTSCTISDASAPALRTGDDVRRIVLDELRVLYPRFDDARVLRVKVIREHAATFAPAPGLEALRPDARGELRVSRLSDRSEHQRLAHLYLAGDWTNTGLPATIEGAVRSGAEAARCVMTDEGEREG